MPSRSWIARSQRRRSLRTCASRAPNGSSSSSTFGSTASARARATRCRCPPDNWSGRRPPISGSWISSSSSVTRRCRSARLGRGRAGPHGQAERNVLRHRHVPEQGIVLEHEPDLPPVHRHVRDVLPGDHHLPGIRQFQPGDDPQQRRLAAAGRAEQRHELPVRDRQVDPDQHRARAEALGDTLQHHAHAGTNLPPCRSSSILATSVSRPSIASSEATAKAAGMLKSL